MNLTDEQLRILRHMLGIDDPWMAQPKPYRNYYCTTAGRTAACASQKTIRHSKAQRIYSKFLDVRDCFPDLTFKQFLTDPYFADTRRAA